MKTATLAKQQPDPASLLRPDITPRYPVIRQGDCSITVGTCGYSYTEWIDNQFYPVGLKNAEMLGQYSSRFQAVELNYTWYQMARADAMYRMLMKSPVNFRFAAKLTRTLTHKQNVDWKKQLALFKQGVEPIRPQLIAILVQLPPSFDRTLSNRRYLANLLDGLVDYPVAVEFRHDSWALDTVFAELERRRVSLVAVDGPQLPGLFPALDVVTNKELFYVRFHGRNKTGWRSSNIQKKFDYNYSREELDLWYEQHLQKMIEKAVAGVIFFNNHVRAQAAFNAMQMAEIIGKSPQKSHIRPGKS